MHQREDCEHEGPVGKNKKKNDREKASDSSLEIRRND